MTYKRAEFQWDEGVSIEIRDGEWRNAKGKLLLAMDIDPEEDANLAIRQLMDKVKAIVKKEIEDQAGGYLNGQPTLAEELGVGITKVGEPSGKLTVAVTPAGAEEGPPLPPEPANLPKPEPVNVPIAENGDELEGFLVKHFVIAVSDSGIKIAKTFGGRVMLHGATAWPEVMEPLFDITDLDKGQKFDPPYPIKAWCTKSAGGWPNKVISFEKV